MLSRESVCVSPVTVLMRDCLVLALRRATSNASPGDVGVEAPNVVFFRVNSFHWNCRSGGGGKFCTLFV